MIQRALMQHGAHINMFKHSEKCLCDAVVATSTTTFQQAIFLFKKHLVLSKVTLVYFLWIRGVVCFHVGTVWYCSDSLWTKERTGTPGTQQPLRAALQFRGRGQKWIHSANSIYYGNIFNFKYIQYLQRTLLFVHPSVNCKKGLPIK